jgi:hypothetical protein
MLRGRTGGSGGSGGVVLHILFFLLRIDSPAVVFCMRFDRGIVLLVTATTSRPCVGVCGHGSCVSFLLSRFLSGPLIEHNVAELGEEKDGVTHECVVGENGIGEAAMIFRQS